MIEFSTSIDAEGETRLPLEIIDYEGQHPDIPEFQKPWENAIIVARGKAEISVKGKPLETEGISNCHIGIVGVLGSEESAMVHFAPLTTGEDFYQQETTLEKFGQVVKFAIILTGTQSNPPHDSLELLDKLGIQVQNRISINTDNQHWAVVYRPAENKIFIDQRSKKKLLVFEGFRQVTHSPIPSIKK